jgi:hypothetical protein
MKVKLTVGELRQLQAFDARHRGKNGFCSFMVELKWRIDDDSGEIDLDDEDFRRIHLYAKRGYKKKILSIFQRTLGSDLSGIFD